ncbi:hypothetical protein P7C73_g102, partial [Tremellales sp. Uapishka_1]
MSSMLRVKLHFSALFTLLLVLSTAQAHPAFAAEPTAPIEVCPLKRYCLIDEDGTVQCAPCFPRRNFDMEARRVCPLAARVCHVDDEGVVEGAPCPPGPVTATGPVAEAFGK